MATIADRIRAWGDETLSNSALSKNEEARNYVLDQIGKLVSEPWAQLAIGKDMPPAAVTASDEPKVK